MLFARVATLLAVLGVAAAAPSAGTPSKIYRLKTTVVSGDATKNDLYVQSYHTGAGLNDVSLVSEGGSAAFINGTYQQFDISGGTFPSGLTLAYGEAYTRWLRTEINAGYGDEGFSFNGNGLVSDNPQFQGWLACDWNHGVPQLFWQINNAVTDLPSSCAKVELRPADL
ncbi:hypothetical protein V493_03891 [Pseudogymnoascus sp. VKM F-4281 (FW-2241)]|nr:hypothetical protein V493_03891 [Pseudogymnoascus sp. VKM F-4281 (FW-2241)]